MYFYFKNIFTFSIVLFLLSSCASVFDGKFEHYSHDEQSKRIAIEKSYAALAKMQNIDIALHLDKEKFSHLVNRSFHQFGDDFKKLHSGEFSRVSFGEIEFFFSAQQAFSKLEFSFVVDAMQREVFGHIKAKHQFRAGMDEFIIGTNFDEIVIEGVEKDDGLNHDNVNRELLSSSVKSFMNALNTEMMHSPLSIPVDMNILKEINGKELFYSPDYKLHSVRPVNMLTKMKMYLPYIYGEGVVFLGASELKNARDTSTAAFDTAGLHEALNKGIDRALEQNMGVTLDAMRYHSVCYVSKAYLSKQMNASLKSMDLRVIKKSLLKPAQQQEPLLKKIMLTDKNDLPACEKAKRDCSALMQVCDRGCEHNYGMHKCEDCSTLNPFEKVRCVSRQEACRSKEELSRYECKKSEQRCKRTNDEIKSKCERDNELLVSRCREKREALLLDDNAIELASMELDFDWINAYAVQRIRSIVFDPDLNTLEVLKDIHVSLDSRISIDVIKGSESDINCSLQIKEPLFSRSSSDYTGERKKLALCSRSLDDGYLLIKAKEKAHTMPVHLNNSAYENLIAQQHLSLDCSFQSIAMPSISRDALLQKEQIPSALHAMAGELELTFETEELSFLVSPVKLGRDAFLYPSMGPKAISFKDESLF